MNGNGQLLEAPPADHVLRWSGRVVAAEDLRRSLNGHRELLVSPTAVITPLSLEQLRERGVQVSRQPAAANEPTPPARRLWGYAQDRPHPMVATAVQSLRREGVAWKELPPADCGPECLWARSLAECVARGEC